MSEDNCYCSPNNWTQKARSSRNVIEAIAWYEKVVRHYQGDCEERYRIGGAN